MCFWRQNLQKCAIIYIFEKLIKKSLIKRYEREKTKVFQIVLNFMILLKSKELFFSLNIQAIFCSNETCCLL